MKNKNNIKDLIQKIEELSLEDRLLLLKTLLKNNSSLKVSLIIIDDEIVIESIGSFVQMNADYGDDAS